jgi:hypothetical protein
MILKDRIKLSTDVVATVERISSIVQATTSSTRVSPSGYFTQTTRAGFWVKEKLRDFSAVNIGVGDFGSVFALPPPRAQLIRLPESHRKLGPRARIAE